MAGSVGVAFCVSGSNPRAGGFLTLMGQALIVVCVENERGWFCAKTYDCVRVFAIVNSR